MYVYIYIDIVWVCWFILSLFVSPMCLYFVYYTFLCFHILYLFFLFSDIFIYICYILLNIIYMIYFIFYMFCIGIHGTGLFQSTSMYHPLRTDQPHASVAMARARAQGNRGQTVAKKLFRNRMKQVQRLYFRP